MPTQDLLTRFRADTRDFDRGTRRIEGGLRRLERTTDRRMTAIDRRMQRAGRAFIGAFAGLATIQGLRSLTRGVEEAVNSLDNIAKQADKLGVTTDALQELRVAAELSGVEIRTFDMAFQRFTRRAAEAANGTGEAKAALEELDIQLRDTNGNIRPTEELLRDVADAFTQVEDPADRVRLAFKLFDSEGVSVINMLQRGGDALDEMRRQARDLGIVIDESLIRRSVAARDQLTLLQRVIDAELTVALAELAPLLVDISGFLADVASATATAYRGMRRFAGVQLDAIEVPRLTEELNQARADLEAFDQDFAQRLENFGQNLSGDQLNAVLEREAERRQAIVDRIEQLQRDLTTATGGAEDVVAEPAPISIPSSGGGGARATTGTTSTTATEERANALQRELGLLAERTAELQRMTAAQARLDPEMEGYQTALRAAEIEARLLARAEAEGIEVKGELAQRIREVAQAYAEAEAATNGLGEAQQELSEAPRIIGDLARGLETAITQAETFEDALLGVLDVLGQIAVQQLQQPGGGIFGSLLGSANGILGGLFGGGTSLFSGTTATFGGGVGTIGTLPFREHGGPVSAGRAYIVGEKRPELFVPDQSGTIIPQVPDEIVVPQNVGTSAGGMGAPVVNQSFDFRGANVSEEQFRRIARETTEEGNKQLMRQMQKQRRLDGDFMGVA